MKTSQDRMVDLMMRLNHRGQDKYQITLNNGQMAHKKETIRWKSI